MEKELELKNISLQGAKSIFSENFLFIILSTTSFLMPIILRHPQFLMGIIINMILIKTAFSFKKSKFFLLAVFPSLGVLTAGILFQESTKYLMYILPFIWFGNYLFMQLIKINIKKNYFVTILISSFVKALFLFTFTFVLYYVNVIPKIFLFAMGYMQFITAFTAGIIMFFESKLETQISKKN